MNGEVAKILTYVALGILIGIIIAYIYLPGKVLFVGTDADLLTQ